MAQREVDKLAILVPSGTLKKIKTMIAIGINELHIPWIEFQTQHTEVLYSDALGLKWILSYYKDDRTLATTLRWRELTEKEIKAMNIKRHMEYVRQQMQAENLSRQALRASDRDDVADAMSYISRHSSYLKGKPNGNT